MKNRPAGVRTVQLRVRLGADGAYGVRRCSVAVFVEVARRRPERFPPVKPFLPMSITYTSTRIS
jgi:hypothetical protein